MTIKISKTQLAYNMKIEGGFLPMLAGLILFLIGTVLPALGVGTLLGLASTGVQKLMVCFLEREIVCVRLKLTGESCTYDLQAVNDLKL